MESSLLITLHYLPTSLRFVLGVEGDRTGTVCGKSPRCFFWVLRKISGTSL